MTSGNFLAFYPQFLPVPSLVMQTFVEQANARFADCKDAAEEARRLYIAHKCTLYAQNYAEAAADGTPTSVAMAKLAERGTAAQAMSKSVGGVSVSKSEGSGIASISGFGELKQTGFGLQLIGLLKIAHAGGTYVP